MVLEFWKAYFDAMEHNLAVWVEPTPVIEQEPGSNIIAFRKTRRKPKA